MTAHFGIGSLAARSNSQIASRTAFLAGQLVLATWLGFGLVASAVQGAEAPSMVFVPAGEADQASRMAVHWSGAPATTVSAWLDFNDDGLWQDHEQVLWQALLAEEMTIFDVEAPGGAQLLPNTRVRLRTHAPGAQPRDSFHTIGGLVGCSWSEEFRSTGMDDTVLSIGTFDDGTGPALYAGGRLTRAGSAPALGIARWDGTSWSALGSGIDAQVDALTVYDDGSGPALYAAGRFEAAGGVAVNKIAKWDGSAWSDVGGGVVPQPGGFASINALEVFDDGSGPALYAGGSFSHAGGVATNNIARWDGTAWSDVSGGVDDTVRTLKVFEHNQAPALMVGGRFHQAGGLTAFGVAAFTGGTWSAVSTSVFSFCEPQFGCSRGEILALEVFDDGSGPALFVGGGFTHVGGVPMANVVKLQGTSWVGLADGTLQAVLALKAFDSGSGPELYAGSFFNCDCALPHHRVAKWDGTSWTALANGADDAVFALEVFDAGDGEKLYLGGEFVAPGGVGASRIASWDGSSWAPLSEEAQGMSSSVKALATLEFAGDTSVYALGSFVAAGTTAARRIARWDGERWHALGEGLDGTVNSAQSVAVYDGGSGEALYVGGGSIMQWDGTTWSGVGGGLSGGGFDQIVKALAVFDDGSGSALFAAGFFTDAGGTPVSHIAKWDGTSWADVGGGFDQQARALTVFDDGDGPALYAAGSFSMAGGTSANRIAKWDGTTWSALDTGMTGDFVFALEVFDDGNGSALYAGGDFDTAGGVGANHIAKWDGTAWSPVSTGLDSAVYSLAVLDEGPESALYVGGNFTIAGGLTANKLARWDGTLWSPTNGGGVELPGWVQALTTFDGPAGPSLFVGGGFEGIGGVPSRFIASYQCSGLFSDGFESGSTSAWTTTIP